MCDSLLLMTGLPVFGSAYLLTTTYLPPTFLPTHSLTCLDKDEFAVCGHGMGPNMAAGAAKLERCKERGGVGPFPFASGTLEVCA